MICVFLMVTNVQYSFIVFSVQISMSIVHDTLKTDLSEDSKNNLRLIE